MLRLVARQRGLNALSLQSQLRVKALHSSANARALQKFAMPAMSPTMTEGGIATWKKSEGDKFAPGDVLLEIETDKATMDVEAQDEGVLAKIVVKDGSKNVQVGSTIAITAEDADEINDADVEKAMKEAESEPSAGNEGKEESAAPKKEESKPAQPEKKEEPKQEQPKKEEKKSESKPASGESSSVAQRDYIFASPIAKRMALDKGIALSQVKGTGPNGRIIKADIENFKGAATSGASASASGSGPLPASTKLPPGSPPAKEVAVPQNYEDIPNSNMRKVIATRLTEAKQSIPMYYLTAEINMDRVLKLREVFNKAASASDKGSKDGVKAGIKLSVNDFIVKASSIALQDVPEVNSAWMGDFVRQYKSADISIAVSTPAGLITPIITNVGGKGLASISSEVKSLATKARDNKLKPHEYQGGTFSISNLGMFGISQFTAIVNPPQSCILAVGGTEQKLVIDEASEKGFKSVNIMKVTMSADHRIVDGAVGARWMASFKEAMENPLSFML